jgi:hypothetical protein
MSQANPYAGEVGVSVGAEDYVFRPSFFAMAALGTPNELPDLYADSHNPTKRGFIAALYALHECCDRDPSDCVGYFDDVHGSLQYVAGAIPLLDVHVLGSKLLYNGMIGKPSKIKRSGPAGKFDPVEYVGAAVAHLGISFDEAWQLTMVEFQQAMRAKFPDAEKEDYPTAEEHRALVESIEGKQNGR